MPYPTSLLARTKTTALVATVITAALLSACSDSDDDSDPVNGMGSSPSPTINLVPDTQLSVPSVGTVYTDADGNTLYTRFTDDPNLVTCLATCTEQWPPLITDVSDQGISGNFDVIERDDGAYQWTLLGYPLYRFTGDAAAGEVNGDGVDDAWAVARPIPVTSAEVDGMEALVALGSTLSDGISATRVEHDQFTLYIFANDSEGVSNCTDGCINAWKPLYADKGAVADGDRYSLIARADGSSQWAYQGMALYFWQGDNAAGDFTGADVANWSVARP